MTTKYLQFLVSNALTPVFGRHPSGVFSIGAVLQSGAQIDHLSGDRLWSAFSDGLFVDQSRGELIVAPSSEQSTVEPMLRIYGGRVQNTERYKLFLTVSEKYWDTLLSMQSLKCNILFKHYLDEACETQNWQKDTEGKLFKSVAVEDFVILPDADG